MLNIIDREKFIELTQKSDDPSIVVDVLPEDHYKKIHIKGAISLPVGKIEKYAQQRLDKDKNVIVYCANLQCQVSAKAAEKLQDLGFDKIYEYADGLEDYMNAGLPLEGEGVAKVEK